MARPVRVASVEEEEHVLGVCPCGSSWALAHEEVVPVRGRWYDALVMKCRTCGSVCRAVFDITPFFEPVSLAWARSA